MLELDTPHGPRAHTWSTPAVHLLDQAWIPAVEQLRAGPLAGLPVVTGGRSSGARVACRTADAVGAVGVLCLAFPLVAPSGKSPQEVLDGVSVPVLVVQGERDRFAVVAVADALDQAQRALPSEAQPLGDRAAARVLRRGADLDANRCFEAKAMSGTPARLLERGTLGQGALGPPKKQASRNQEARMAEEPTLPIFVEVEVLHGDRSVPSERRADFQLASDDLGDEVDDLGGPRALASFAP